MNAENTTMDRAEWERRFAARLMDVAGIEEHQAMHMAKVAADEHLENNGDEWLDPEDDADEEMSYWDDDGEDGQ